MSNDSRVGPADHAGPELPSPADELAPHTSRQDDDQEPDEDPAWLEDPDPWGEGA